MNETKFLDDLVTGREQISVYLLSGIKLAGGRLEAHDSEALFLRQPIAQGGGLLMIYKINVLSAGVGKQLARKDPGLQREAQTV
jgi:sRNA-binding regulator protein Hfq